MVSASIFKLCGCNIKNTLSCTFRDQMYESQEILAGITESHTAACAGFVIGSRTGHIEGYHTLVLIPDIGHTVYIFVLTFYMVTGEQIGPVSIQLCKCCINLLCCLELFQDFVSPILADYIRSNEFLILRIFTVAKNENQITGFSGGKCKINLMACNRIPAAGYGIACFVFLYSIRERVSVIMSQESISACVISVYRTVYAEEAVMFAAFAVLCFVINCAAFDFNFTNT